MLIQRLTLNKILSFNTASVELGPLNVLIGPNAVGKSNLIEIIEELGGIRGTFTPNSKEFYGGRFKAAALKQNPKAEEISKADLKSGLANATKSSRKGNYFDNKTSHGPKLLALLDPALVQQAAPNCKKLFDAVSNRLSQPPA
jgi:recombinational DNA repair ATPase RecF